MIYCGFPLAQYEAHRREIDDAITRVLAGGRYVLGPEVQAFETEFASYTGACYGVGVGSGTEAIHVALKACGVGPGDEVITVSHTAIATISAIQLTGAVPVLVDIDPLYFTISPDCVAKAITDRTRVIIPVHLYGQMADMDRIMEIARSKGIKVIEDCAQAHGAVWNGRIAGSIGDAGCFSFYPTKNLGAIGDGGMIVTSDPDIAKQSRLLREYGWSERYVSHVSGWNTRLDEIQAAILRVKLKHLDAGNEARRRIALEYNTQLAVAGLNVPQERPGCLHVYHLYVVRSDCRDVLQKHLAKAGVGALVHYPVPVHLQPAYAKSAKQGSSLRETELAAQTVLSLPMYPELSSMDIAAVISLIHSYFGMRRRG